MNLQLLDQSISQFLNPVLLLGGQPQIDGGNGKLIRSHDKLDALLGF